MEVRHELPKNWWFLPNGDFMVSWCIGSRVDLISSWRNHFYDFCSLSSLITLPCQHFAYIASHLTKIKTIINAPLGLPLLASTRSGGKNPFLTIQRPALSLLSMPPYGPHLRPGCFQPFRIYRIPWPTPCIPKFRAFPSKNFTPYYIGYVDTCIKY
jgi:hypothetical protein